MSQIHAHRFGLGDSIGSVGPSNGQVQNLYNKGRCASKLLNLKVGSTGRIYDHLLPHAEQVKVAHLLMLRDRRCGLPIPAAR